MILDKPTVDIDVMVIGDGVEFAGKVAAELNDELSAVYKKFGTALLEHNEYKIEFASARKESYNRDSRKPDVEFSGLEDDLARRDFTINALAVSLNSNTLDQLTDIFGGVDDIENKIIRTPLAPEKTFDDDPLRIMRAIRFASVLDFSIETGTYDAIVKMKDRLKEDSVVSQERITDEFLKILMSPKPSIGLDLLFKTGVMEIIFPEMSNLAGVDQRKDYHHKDVFYHTLQVVDNISQKTDNVWLRFAALVHDIAKPPTKKFVEGTGWTFHGHEELGARMMKKIFKKLRLPMSKLPYVEKLVRMHLRPIPLAKDEVTDSAIRRLAADAGEELEDLLTLCRADITSKDTSKISRFMSNYDIVEQKIRDVQEKDQLRNFQSPVRGEEIMEICNLEPSRKVGVIKKRIEEAILDGEIPNEYEAAKEYLYKIKDEILK
ncbi:MAG: HD domain-containing protein [Ignavibacteriae bacterium]|nr:HD domain-containing protein [Ignavibacteriota bacterium]MCB9243091.1 HD domain-containing protein [Ignavibacteriales bacterium]